MNIGILVSSLNFGGAEKQSILDANMLSIKHKVYLFYFYDGDLKKLVLPGVYLIQLKKQGYISAIFQLIKAIKKNKIQILHSSLFASIFSSSIASIFSNVKVIWHFHSHEYNAPIKTRLAFKFLAKLKGVKRILFVNHELMEYWSFSDFPRHKMGVLYNHSEIDVIPKVSINNEIINIGYIGRVIGLKRVHFLLDLAKFLKERSLTKILIHIVGDGESLIALKERVEVEGLMDYIVFHGFQTDVIHYYSLFDFFVNPSSEECLSIAMIDAGMMSLPIVAFNVGGNNEIVINSQTGFIVDSIDDLLEKCLLLCNSSELRQTMGENSRAHCNSLFSKNRHASELQKIYETLS